MKISLRLIVVGLIFLIQSISYASTTDKFHDVIFSKYGVAQPQILVKKVVNIDEIHQLQHLSLAKYQELMNFAESIEADYFEYNINNKFWALYSDERFLAYTYSLEILKNGTKTFDYHCLALMDQDKVSGFTAGCAAFDATD